MPAAFVNSALDYLNKIIAIFYRENLTKNLHDKYLTGMSFYQIINLDTRISNPDQIFTNDVEKWATSFSNLYVNFTKPLLDLILFTRKLSTTMGLEGPLMMMGWFLFSSVCMRYMSPSFGKLTAIEQALEGDFRACHSNLITHSEEIAFYKGNNWEESRLNVSFNVWIINNLFNFNLIYNRL